MLTIRRSAGEGIVIGNSIVITVLEVDTDHVRLVIEDRENGDDVRIVDWPNPDGLEGEIDASGDRI
jgi:carbon storage regulator CsrA